jgi:hypothetical protein
MSLMVLLRNVFIKATFFIRIRKWQYRFFVFLYENNGIFISLDVQPCFQP